MSHIEAAPKLNKHIAAVKDADGNLKTNQEDIAEAFAAFYQTLYEAPRADQALGPGRGEVRPEDLIADIRDPIKTMKSNKTCSDDGIVA